ncbi:OXSM [Cordylochernes scorpioides]|uniref:beta-ketoacyl-[acyl-carrier-protein] synthase I n=1 Tax=Cordylochernes scorpioides TaxID=51811 RepID=A0ABY6JXJ9_9ARAC|nr:OXSM [Cordylochernes scorpioides]
MDQRTCIKFCVKNEIKCADAFRMLTVAYGEATLDRSNVYRWYKMFSEVREDVNDEKRAGRPSTSTTDEKINEVEKMILANRRITVREFAEDLNISIGSCHSIFINDLGMRRVAAKFVPKLLNCDQKQHRMNIANEMLDSVRDDPNLLQRVITGDEAWVYGYDVETKAQSSQWKLPHEPRPKKARQVRSNVKVLLRVFFDCRGVVFQSAERYWKTLHALTVPLGYYRFDHRLPQHIARVDRILQEATRPQLITESRQDSTRGYQTSTYYRESTGFYKRLPDLNLLQRVDRISSQISRQQLFITSKADRMTTTKDDHKEEIEARKSQDGGINPPFHPNDRAISPQQETIFQEQAVNTPTTQPKIPQNKPVHSLRHFSSTGLPAQRVVVTGMGAVTPLGVGTSTAWKALLAGRSGIVALDGEEYQNIPAKVAAPIPNLDLTTLFRNSELNSMSRATAFALIAAAEAFNDAGWQPGTEEECEGTGVVVGMGMSDLADILHTGTLLRDRGYNKVSPFFVPRILINMAAGQISIKYKLKGPNHCSSTACATGVHAIGDAYNLIRSGQAQAMMCGSTEAVISPLSIAAFARMKALSSSFNSTPEIASRPFDKQREGFVMGEGAGILLLESLEHAQKRNAKVYAEILGYGLSGDAHHITAPSKDGGGALRCMRSALKNSGMPITSVGYINAHATSTPLGDAVEIEAIRRTFEQHVSNLKISSSKGSIGHLLGGAGSVESIFTILACHHGICPPTLNLQEADDKFKDLNLVPLIAQSWSDTHRIAVKNSFGFGGTNASLVIGSYS